jgi:spore germination cell wall hydrolase CwlJ-like protein
MIGTTAIMCLALNIYFESRDQDIVGQIAVAEVVMNRVEDPRYPDDICKVVMQGPVYTKTAFPVRHKCQFSWYCDGKSDKAKDKEAFAWAYLIAKLVTTTNYTPVTKGATHYHADYIFPDWAETKILTTVIGNHAFYRWKRKDLE